MHEIAAAIHYASIALIITSTVISSALGQGRCAKAVLESINIQPAAAGEIARLMLFGMGLIETATVLCFTFICMILVGDTRTVSYTTASALADIGIACALAIPSFLTGFVAALPAYEAMRALARQPFFAPSINRFMLIGQSLMQTPVVFGLIIAFLIKNSSTASMDILNGVRLLAAGLTFGLGSVGPLIGLGTLAVAACRQLGINRHAYGKLFTLMLIGNATIEAPMFFAIIITMFMIGDASLAASPLKAICLVAGACCMGLGSLGAGINSGRIAATAATQVGKNPTLYGSVSRVSLIAQGLIDTSAIYAFLITLMVLLLVN